MQVWKKSWAAVIAVAFLAACNQVPAGLGTSAPASSAGATNGQAPAPGGMPVTINCGEGKQALVKQVSFDGKSVSQVDCVDMPRVVASRDAALIEDDFEVAPAPAPVRRTVQRAPVRERVIVREVPREREVIRDEEEPRVYRTSSTRRDDDVRMEDEAPARSEGRTTRSRGKRPGEQSALIIAGSTAAGAGAGAIVGGKKGAIIGAVIGGVGGTIYDRKTRNPK